MKKSVIAFAIAVLALAPGATAQPLVDFETNTTGGSVEGLGAVHPLLNIHAVNGTAVVIETGALPATYGGPQVGNVSAGPGPSRRNNCLEDASRNRVNVNVSSGATAKGFGDQDAPGTHAQDFDFTFAPGVRVAAFSVRMFDFGDFNPTGATTHSVTLTGFDALGSVSDILSYTSTGAGNPRGGSAGDLFITGDACDAAADLTQPGYYEFKVQGAGILRVELRATGFDPNVGFDSISFTLDVGIDIKPQSDPNCFNITGHGVIPVAILGSSTFDVLNINEATVLFDGLEVRVRGSKGPLCSIEDSNGDSFPDLICHFEDNPDNWEVLEGDTTATVSGELLDGTLFEGTDSICIVP